MPVSYSNPPGHLVSLASQSVPHSYASNSVPSTPSYFSSPEARVGGWCPSPRRPPVAARSPTLTPERLSPGVSSVTTDQSLGRVRQPAYQSNRKPSKKDLGNSSRRTLIACKDDPEHLAKAFDRNGYANSGDNSRSRVRCDEHGCNKDFGRQADLARHKRSVSSGHSVRASPLTEPES